MITSFISDCNHQQHGLNNTSTLASSRKAHQHRDSGTSAMTTDSQQSMISYHRSPVYSYTWLVFKDERWQPFDTRNQFILEETLSVDGTFVDISEPINFPGVKKVRVFPRNNYLSYLGLKYRMSRVLQPDAWSWFS